MKLNTVTVTEAVRNCSDYINRVVYRHESFVLCKGKKAVAELRPVPTGRCLGDLASILHNLPRLQENDSASFVEDIESSRKLFNQTHGGDPWESR